jgi:hypothetical protein
LLELIAARSSYGVRTELSPVNDAPLADVKDPREFKFLVDHLPELGYLTPDPTDKPFNCSLRVKGWEALQPTASIPGRCFVAMSFHDDLKEAWEKGIYLAVKDECKMDPVRVDFVEYNEKICDKIVAEIRTSACQFLVADVTLQRAGVYFEAGFAMGLGRLVARTSTDGTS